MNGHIISNSERYLRLVEIVNFLSGSRLLITPEGLTLMVSQEIRTFPGQFSETTADVVTALSTTALDALRLPGAL